MKNLNISVLEGCKDVEGNLHKVGDSYIGQHSAFSSSQYQNKKVCSATKNCSGWLQKNLLVLKKKKMQLKNHLLSINIIIAIIITFHPLQGVDGCNHHSQHHQHHCQHYL